MLSRRNVLQLGSLTAIAAALPRVAHASAKADYTLSIAPYTLQISRKHEVKTIAYNQQVPGPLLRLKENRPVTIDVVNQTGSAEIVHWHGLFLPSEIDGAMEEGTPMIAAGAQARYVLTPRPAGFRWYHTHVKAGRDLRKGQYSGLHGFLSIDGNGAFEHFDQEFFLALHDWDGQLQGSGDGSMNPAYNFATVNGKVLGFGEPLRVKAGEQILLHILNSSATEVHWLALAGHQFRVLALDGNRVPNPQTVSMLRLAPAERVCALVEMNHPGLWILGEVRKHIQAAGMGVVVEYAGRTGAPAWTQPQSLVWDYTSFGSPPSIPLADESATEIPLVFESRFAGHGAPDRWMINGKSFPDSDVITLATGQRYRFRLKNRSMDDHPIHLHRHSFELHTLSGDVRTRGLIKDVVLIDANSEALIEFTANNPGSTLFHCHQQNHMDEGFMMLFRYA